MANVTQPDPFKEGEETLIKPDHHHHGDLEGTGDDVERESIEELGETSERSKANAGEKLFSRARLIRKPRAEVGERNNFLCPCLSNVQDVPIVVPSNNGLVLDDAPPLCVPIDTLVFRKSRTFRLLFHPILYDKINRQSR